MRYNRLKKQIETDNAANSLAGSVGSSSAAGGDGTEATSSGQKRGRKRKVDECSGRPLEHGDDDEYLNDAHAKSAGKLKKEPKVKEENKSDALMAIAENNEEGKGGDLMEVILEEL